MNRITHAALNGLIWLEMLAIRLFLWNPLLRKTHHPQAAQDELLLQIIRRAQNTRFGEIHGLESIHSYQQFQVAVPVHTYDELSPYIKEQDRGVQALHPERPVLFSITSGTTGKPKYIPIFPSTRSQFRKAQKLFFFAQQRHMPEIYQGKILAIGSPAVEGTLDSGTPYGSVSGLLFDTIPRLVQRKYVLPREVLEIEDYPLKYFLICAWSLSEPDLTFCASANPSTFLKIMEVIRKELVRLADFIETADISLLPKPKLFPQALADRLFKPCPQRAEFLRTYIGREDTLTCAELWPRLKSIATWTGGNCRLLIPKLRSLLPATIQITELGYLSSEFRGSLTVDAVKNISIPALDDNFYEFVEVESWDSGHPAFLTLDKIEPGKHYYVIVTTQNGLFRYFINDIIEVTGFFNNTPAIEFIQKGKGVTNLTGEKLTELQVIQALGSISDIPSSTFFMMLADPGALQYSLYIEIPPRDGLEQDMEEGLSRLNVEFREKRKSERLHPTQIFFLKEGTGEEYRKDCLRRNQREGQFKTIHLQYSRDCPFDFSPYYLEPNENQIIDPK